MFLKSCLVAALLVSTASAGEITLSKKQLKYLSAEMDKLVGRRWHKVVHATQFGRAWPFTVNSGEVVRDPNNPRVVWFNYGPGLYAISDAANVRGAAMPYRIWKRDPKTGKHVSLKPILKVGNRLGL